MSTALITLKIDTEQDVLRLRFIAMAITKSLQFGTFSQTRAVTALLEAARNAQQHAAVGRARLSLQEHGKKVALRAIITDQGPGVEGLEDILRGRRGGTGPGLGLGLRGLSRLSDHHAIRSGPEGTEIELLFLSPVKSDEMIASVQAATDAISKIRDADPVAELAEQNRVLLEALTERDLLMKEVHHRTGNNLALIGALIRMSRRGAEAPETVSVLSDLEARVQSVIRVHEQLQRSARVDHLQAVPFLQEVATNAEGAFNSDSLNVSVSVRGDDIEIPSSMAIDLGLITGELLTNAYKHAFVGREQGNILVELTEQDDALRLVIADDGRGLAEGDARPERSGSLGWRMIRSMVGKYAGTTEVDGSNGMRVQFTLPFAREQADRSA
ncbi:Signal transduction histidine kinase (plasmid) [Phaeobacter piscinae]|uniref:histidine kinase n=1 Tax=Phaeobacter piscinae TaxID=1580596 RepID=A0ABM6PJ31_9RHOB|nr:ATP-binding protein [Phaeobacter piscinae]ATG37629.1 Signal transduction histidine kinase [Phaeobacter piscinae]AUQ88150.1 Signal transduction histidine kinase [Phaeobacter piscinae]AUR26033.1 Signal transduction histidine kinase [Phaeobacter piscinae]